MRPTLDSDYRGFFLASYFYILSYSSLVTIYLAEWAELGEYSEHDHCQEHILTIHKRDHPYSPMDRLVLRRKTSATSL